jgi:hypothetical protein
MPTIIDSLIVTLGLDNDSFKKGIKETDKVKEEHEEKSKVFDKKRREASIKEEREKASAHKEQLHRNKEIVEGFSRLRNETLAFLTIFTAGKGLLSFVSDTIVATAALGHLAENVEMGIGNLAGWQYAMKEVGGTAEGASAAVDRAAIAIGAFHAGLQNTSVQGLFTAAGGTGVDLKGAFKDTESFLLAQADVVHKLYERNPTDAMIKARQMMGIDPETFNLLKQGREKLLQQVELGRKISGINKSQAEDSQKALRDWVKLTTQLESVGRTLLFKVLKTISGWMKTHAKEIDKWVNDFNKAITNIDPKSIEAVGTALASIVETIALSIEGWKLLMDLWGQGLPSDLNQNGTAKTKQQILDEESGLTAYYDKRKKLGLSVPARFMSGPGMVEAARAGGKAPGSVSSSTTSVTVQKVEINTQATDAKGIAKDFHSELNKSYGNVAQANAGM